MANKVHTLVSKQQDDENTNQNWTYSSSFLKNEIRIKYYFLLFYLLKDPADWKILFPSANGLYQSPIDIVQDEAIYSEKLLEKPLKIHYNNAILNRVLNNGHTFIVNDESIESCKFL
jgi:hypothetical protein